MRPSVVVTTVAALAVLAIVNVMLAPSQDTYRRVRTTHGHGPDGQAALVDLLRELGYAAPRTYATPDQWPPGSVVWLIAPTPQRGLAREPERVLERLMPWVEGGGTAVVFGEPVGGFRPLDLAVEPVESAEPTKQTSGTLLPGRFDLPLDAPVFFEDTGDLEVMLYDEARRPFVVESEHGAGRIVAVADARFLFNRHIARDDASVLAVELVRRLGPPIIDEYFHGLRITPTLVEEAGWGRLVLMLVPLLGLAWVMARLAEPWSPREHTEPETLDISLATFVDALSSHYTKTHDTAAAFRAYRDGFLHRLRRRTGSTDDAAFRRRVERDPRLDETTRGWLLGDTGPRNRGELVRAVHRLEQYAEARR